MTTTHYVPDGLGWRSRVAMALCGRHVNPLKEHSITPTCEKCAEQLAIFEALVGDPNEVFGGHARSKS